MTSNHAVPAQPRRARALDPVALMDYRITGGFWKDVQDLNRDAVIPHCDNSLEEVGWVENFRAAVRGSLTTDRVGRLFTDSEIYKTIEAMTWENARMPSEGFAARIAELARLVSQAQEPDGYLNTYYGYEGGPERYTDFEWGHELYCAGHLLQAAVAAIRVGGDETLVGVARRLADHICKEFRPGRNQMLGGHPEIETALVELYRATGEVRYLDQAKAFVDRRGHRVLADTMYKGRDYYQDNVPVRKATVLVGHAVRALYLAAGAIDVAVETGDDELLAAVKGQYDRTLERRTYLTGGMGSNHHGETFGEDYELPSERAYAETCAAVASIHVAWRLLLATGDARYGDVIERTLYNNVVSAPSIDGRSFFYVNALQRRSPGIKPEPGVPSLRRTDGTRAAWYTTSCCPTNMARLLASLSAYVATVNEEGVQIHQFTSGTLEAQFGAGRRAQLSVATSYPNDGRITVRVERSDEMPWTLSLRVPGWTTGATIVVAGEERAVKPGTLRLTRTWNAGEEVVLDLNVRPRFVYPDPRIDHLRGCVAVERGPLVYALESVDQPGLDLDLTTIDPRAGLADSAVDLGIGTVVPVTASGTVLTANAGWPYSGQERSVEAQPVELTLIPYFRWANRGSSTMRVWTPCSRPSHA